jgi:hypothetical protein
MRETMAANIKTDIDCLLSVTQPNTKGTYNQEQPNTILKDLVSVQLRVVFCPLFFYRFFMLFSLDIITD